MKVAHALLFVVLACTTDPTEDSWSEFGKADDPTAGGVVPTYALEVRVLDGFNALLDTPAGRCVEASGNGPPYSVGAVTKRFELAFISKKDDLANKLGIDMGLKIKYGAPLLQASTSFVDHFKQSSMATHLLVTASASYRVTNQQQGTLTEEARTWLMTEPFTFLHRCGNFLVNGVEFEAQLFLLIRFEARTAEAARTINGELSVAAGTGLPVELDANVKSKLEALANRQDVHVDMYVLDRGFVTDGGTGSLISSLLASGVSGATFDKLDSVRSAMLTSLAADACRDAGPSCQTNAPGYAANTARNAVPVRLDLKSYARTQNAPVGGPSSSYERIREIIDRMNRHLRALAKVAGRMETILRDEIEPFMHATAQQQALYGIAPPAPAVFSMFELVERASAVRLQFSTYVEGGIATRLGAVISGCWTAAQEGAFEICAAPEQVSSLPQVRAAEDAIKSYVATARVVPLRFAANGPFRYDQAYNACAMSAMRLPTSSEAQRLAMPIALAELPRTNEERLKYAAWHSDRALCPSDNYPAFSNVANGPHGNVCTVDSFFSQHPVTTLCVPPGGPFEGLVSL